MTYAPRTIREVRVYLKGEDPDLSDVELGIVGGPSHKATGTSYHLGEDELKMWKNPYSARTPRDRAGLNDAASALDVDDDLDELRELSVWVVEECRAGAPDTLDLREVIYSPDGVQVLQWDRERGRTSKPQPHPDKSHRKHSHFSWYRDSEHRDKVGLFKRFYRERGGGNDVELTKAIQEALKAAGIDPGPIDGIPGPNTKAALTAAFKRAGTPGPEGPPGPPGPPGQPGRTAKRVAILGEVTEYAETGP